MFLRAFSRDRLDVRIYSDRWAAGAAGAQAAAALIRKKTVGRSEIAIVFASALSQVPFLAALRTQSGIPWQRITAFHMDEYAGIAPDHPASFRRFLREHLLNHVPVAAFHELRGDSPDPAAECARYEKLLRTVKPALAVMGIGENGHLAFIDPPGCNFEEPRAVLPVELDAACRMQQVHDGAFETIEDVPERALSLTVPFFLEVPRALVLVNGARKSTAVRDALHGPISCACPASALRLHSGATMFLDPAAAGL